MRLRSETLSTRSKSVAGVQPFNVERQGVGRIVILTNPNRRVAVQCRRWLHQDRPFGRGLQWRQFSCCLHTNEELAIAVSDGSIRC